jgi:spore germination cell wall hydrolase CwlJ-like protein
MDNMKKFILLCFVLISCTAFSGRIAYEPKLSEYKNEVRCLAQNIYFEARDQLIKGQIAVALVTINRVESRRFPNTICKVIHQGSRYDNGEIKKDKCHFSWYCDGKSDRPRDRLAWKISMLISRAMLLQPGVHIKRYGEPWPIEDFLHGATHYHRVDISPYWNRKMIKVATIGDHVFWKDYLND